MARSGPLHVLLVAPDVVSHGASSARARAIVRGLRAAGHTLSLVTSRVPAADDVVCKGVEILHVPDTSRRTLIDRAARRLFGFPDPNVFWARRAIRRLKRLPQRPDVVLVTTPPHSAQAVGTWVNERYSVPYVADLRDDWVGNHRARHLTRLHRLSAVLAERRMVRAASCLIANTEQMKRQFLSRHPGAASKTVVITNGFEAEDFSATVPERHPDTIRIGYFGSGYGTFVDGLLAGIASELRERGVLERFDLVASIIGATKVAGGAWRALRDLGPRESAEQMRLCDVLLLVMPPGEREPSPTVPLKTYAYLRSGATVIYCGERGATSDLLEQFEGTVCVPRDSAATIAKTLCDAARTLKGPWPRPDVSKYDTRVVVGQIDAILRAVAVGAFCSEKREGAE